MARYLESPALAHAFADQGKAAADHMANLRRLEAIEELGYAAQHEASEATRQGGRIPSRAAGRRDTYFKTKNKLETQRREVDTKITAASGQRFLTNLPRDREELKAAYEDGNPSRANDRRRRADLLGDHASPSQRPTNVKKLPTWPAALSFGETSAVAALRR